MTKKLFPKDELKTIHIEKKRADKQNKVKKDELTDRLRQAQLQEKMARRERKAENKEKSDHHKYPNQMGLPGFGIKDTGINPKKAYRESDNNLRNIERAVSRLKNEKFLFETGNGTKENVEQAQRNLNRAWEQSNNGPLLRESLVLKKENGGR